MLIISKIQYHGEYRIKVQFDYNKSLVSKIKIIPTARYSHELNAWHLAYNKEIYKALTQLGIPVKIITNDGHTKIINPENKKASTSLSHNGKNEHKNIDNSNIKNKQKNPCLNIEIHNKHIFIKTPYQAGRIKIIKSLKGAWWNNKYRNWIAKACIENIEILQKNFNYWDNENYKRIYDMVALRDDPLVLELYRTPDNIKNVWVKISGYRADIDFMKHIPDRFYDKRFKRWQIPFKQEIIDRIIEHYQKLGAKIINRLPGNDKSRFEKKHLSYGEKQEKLLRKFEGEYRELVKKVTDVLIAQRYSWQTITLYTGNIVKFAQFYGHADIDSANADDVNKYISYKASTNVSDSKLNILISALKFYYTKVIFRPDFEIERIKRPRKALTLPNILSKKEISMILKALDNIKHVTILYTLYSSGLRLNEILNLRVQDISFDRNQIFVHRGKGKKDRVVMLSNTLKELLILYTEKYKPVYWLFEGKDKQTQYTDSSVQKIVRKAAAKAGITKKVTPHKIRHCFATHLLDAGTDIRYIQELLGHKDIKTTLIYTHVTTRKVTEIKSPLDDLDI